MARLGRTRPLHSDLDQLPGEVECKGRIGAGSHAEPSHKAAGKHLPGGLIATVVAQEAAAALKQMSRNRHAHDENDQICL